MDITFTLQSITDGSLITGATGITVYISKDGGSFAASTNAAQEIGRGLYKVTLTSAESEFTTLYYQPVCTGAQTNLWSIDAPVTMPTVPSASDNAQAVWGAQTKIVTIDSTQAATLATAAALTTVGDNVTAIKAKTDNLPSSPAAVGDAMTLTDAYDAAKTASQFDPANTAVTIDTASVEAVQSGLSTFDPSTTAVTLDSEQLATLATAQALAAQSGLLDVVAASILHWSATASTLTLYDSTGAAIANYALTRDSSGNITAIAPAAEDN